LPWIKSGLLVMTSLWNVYACYILAVVNRFYPRCSDPPLTLADPVAVRNACAVLKSAERPLVIIGKG